MPEPPTAIPGQPPYPAAPPKKSRLRLWITLGAVVLVLFCGGTAGAGFLTYRLVGDRAEPSAAPQAGPIRLVVPKKLFGQPRVRNEKFQRDLDALTSKIKDMNVSSGTISAVYGHPSSSGKGHAFFATAGEFDPKTDFTSYYMTSYLIEGKIIGGISNADKSKLVEVSPGPLGGTALCGDITVDGTDVALCGWADEFSIGAVFFFSERVSRLGDRLIQVRGQIEIKA